MAGSCAYADKVYCSQMNRHVLQGQGLSDGIMHKATRNRALSAAEKAANRLIRSVRAKVELEFLHNAMAFNLKKAVIMAEC
jgi:transposase, IS5 family